MWLLYPSLDSNRDAVYPIPTFGGGLSLWRQGSELLPAMGFIAFPCLKAKRGILAALP